MTLPKLSELVALVCCCLLLEQMLCSKRETFWKLSFWPEGMWLLFDRQRRGAWWQVQYNSFKSVGPGNCQKRLARLFAIHSTRVWF